MWAGFRQIWDRLILPYWLSDASTVIKLSIRGTVGSGIWLIWLYEQAVPWRLEPVQSMAESLKAKIHAEMGGFGSIFNTKYCSSTFHTNWFHA